MYQTRPKQIRESMAKSAPSTCHCGLDKFSFPPLGLAGQKSPNAPAQPRRPHAHIETTPRLPPAGGCSGWLGDNQSRSLLRHLFKVFLGLPANPYTRRAEESTGSTLGATSAQKTEGIKSVTADFRIVEQPQQDRNTTRSTVLAQKHREAFPALNVERIKTHSLNGLKYRVATPEGTIALQDASERFTQIPDQVLIPVPNDDSSSVRGLEFVRVPIDQAGKQVERLH